MKTPKTYSCAVRHINQIERYLADNFGYPHSSNADAVRLAVSNLKKELRVLRGEQLMQKREAARTARTLLSE